MIVDWINAVGMPPIGVVVPFLVADFVRLVLLVSIPALSLYLPALLM